VNIGQPEREVWIEEPESVPAPPEQAPEPVPAEPDGVPA
jgi:hypothetical protein